MSTASEMLAAQLRSPGFRSAEPGYEPEDVLDHLAVVHDLVTGLQQRLADTTARAAAAEEAAARAEAHAPVPDPDDDELLAVVFEGQRTADDLVASAEERAAAIGREADARIAELRDDREVRRLTAAVEETRRQVDETLDAVRQLDDDLRSTAEATRHCRAVVDERLGAALAFLADIELVTEHT
jgi:hypothetical protein